MDYLQPNPARLYLPLLAHAEPLVRRHACLILLGQYDLRAVSYLRRLADDADVQIRQEARLALLAVAEVTDSAIKVSRFHSLHIECLGRLRVYAGNYELQPQDWSQAEGGRAGWQKVQAALAYLVHCGRRGASREALGAAVWGAAFSPTSLARTLSTLRQALAARVDAPEQIERALVINGDFCMLDPECYHTDLRMFERAYDLAVQCEAEQDLEAAAPLYGQAFELYAGPYMADVLRGSGWAQTRRDYLNGNFVIAAERLAERAFAQQQYQRCVTLCLSGLNADPRADDLVVWLLRAYAEQGRHADLEHAYHGYLRAADLQPHSAAAEHDPVAQVYQDVRRVRV